MSGVGGNIGVFKVCSSIGNSQHLADSSSKLEKSDLKKIYIYIYIMLMILFEHLADSL